MSDMDGIIQKLFQQYQLFNNIIYYIYIELNIM